MGLRSVLGSAVGGLGNAVGLPELGLSELVSGSNRPRASASVVGDQTSNSYQDPTTYQDPNFYGSVQGAATNTPGLTFQPLNSGGGGGGGAAAAQANNSLQDLETDAVGRTNSSYDIYTQDLERQIGLLPQQRVQLEDQINSLYGSSKGDLDIQRDSTNRKFDQAGAQIDSRQNSSLRDMENNMMNQQNAFFRKAGAMGAGNSSVTDPRGVGAYAFAKLGSQNRTAILEQANALQADLGQKRVDLESAFGQQVSKLNEWKNNQIRSITDSLSQQENQLRSQMAGSNAQRAAEIRDLIVQFRSQAINNLQQVEQYVGGVNSNLTNAAQQQSHWIDTQRQRLSEGMSVVDPSTLEGSFDAGSGNFQGTSFNGGLGIQSRGSGAQDLMGGVTMNRDENVRF